MKVVFCVPFLHKPTDPFIKALEDSIPAVEAAGWEHGLAQHMGNPYISSARAEMTRKALDAGADVIMYLDYDVSWSPEDMVKILEIEEYVVAGTYRFKCDDKIEYMGMLKTDEGGKLLLGNHGCVQAERAPAGFLKVTRGAIGLFAKKYPELLYGDPMKPHLDLFNHGAHGGVWWGEDYAFSRRWNETGNPLWLYPDLNINHHSSNKIYRGNFHLHLQGRDHEICDSISAV